MKHRSTLSLSLVFCFGISAATACSPETDQSQGQATGPSSALAGTNASPVTPPRAGAPAAGGGAPIGVGSAGVVAPPPPSQLPAAGTRAPGAGTAGMTGLPRAGAASAMPPGAGAAGRSAGAAGQSGTAMAAAGSGGPAAGSAAAPGGSTGGGSCGDGTATDGRPTSGPLACIVEQHNAVRAMVKSATPLPPVTWSAEIAKYAQEWTDMTCMNPMHRMRPSLNGKPLGENLYASGGVGDTMPGKNAVDGWAGEVACYTYGAFMTADKCDMMCTTNMHSDGCGHYTQVVWRASTEIGCGVTTCGSGFNMRTEVICNYAPAGNYVGMNPY